MAILSGLYILPKYEPCMARPNSPYLAPKGTIRSKYMYPELKKSYQLLFSESFSSFFPECFAFLHGTNAGLVDDNANTH